MYKFPKERERIQMKIHCALSVVQKKIKNRQRENQDLLCF